MSRRRELSAVPRISRADEVRRQLEAAIVAGDYQPGERLPSERELVELFGVSRLSVREGIKGLIGMGIVEARHGRGYFVSPGIGEIYRNAFAAWLTSNSDQLIDMYQIRGALTTLAAHRALLRREPSAVEDILAAHEAFVRAVQAGADAEQIADLDVRFHRSIAEASGSALIASLLNDLYDRLEEPRQTIMDLPGQGERSAREHQVIVDALRTREPAAVAQAIDAHIGSVCRTIEEYAAAARKR
jgi:GntR family transcriptional repressor for pyruvate dehydrogenase complex